jgi:hypothetical protein
MNTFEEMTDMLHIISDLNSIRGTVTACPLIVRLARVKQPLVPYLVELLVHIVILVEFRIDVLNFCDPQPGFFERTPPPYMTVVAIKFFLIIIIIIIIICLFPTGCTPKNRKIR